MSIYIVDASVAAKWFIKEEHHEVALSLFKEGNELHTPDFLFLEMDNILCKWIRRGIITDKESGNIRKALRQYPIQIHPFSLLLDSAYVIANQMQRSVYDCLYVALAALLEGQMVTADRRLYNGLADGPFAKSVVWIRNIS